MTRYTLESVAPTTWHIKTGRARVGHVSQIAGGTFIARIGAATAAGETVVSVFRRVTAKAEGYPAGPLFFHIVDANRSE